MKSRLILFVLFNALIHFLLMLAGFGEPDQARITLRAMKWIDQGQYISDGGYLYRVSPAYLHATRLLIEWGIPMRIIPIVQNAVSVLAGSLSLAPAFFIFRRISGSSVVAGWSTAFLACTPAFFVAGLYGMPHVPAFLFFMIAVERFFASLNGSRAWLVVVFVSMALATCLKADILLCGGVFIGAVYLGRGQSVLTNWLLAGMIPASGLAAVLVYASLISGNVPSLLESTSGWTSKYPFTLYALTNLPNLSVNVFSFGPIVSIALLLSFAHIVVSKDNARFLVFALLWGGPSFLFWGLILGNSARHLMAAIAPFLLVLVVCAFHFFSRDRACLFLGTLLLANYFSRGVGFSTIRPSPRLVESARAVRARSERLHEAGRRFAESTGKRLYRGTWSLPYITFELRLAARRGLDTSEARILSHADPTILGAEWRRFESEGDRADDGASPNRKD